MKTVNWCGFSDSAHCVQFLPYWLMNSVLLFIAQHASAADQLSLALIWNRADIARTEIFTEDQKWEVWILEIKRYILHLKEIRNSIRVISKQLD